MKKNKWNWLFQKEKLIKISRVMRLTFLMLLCFELSLSAKVYSQTDKFNVQKSNATVKEIFDEVMSQSNYHFFYNNEFDVNRSLSMHVKNADIDEVLKKVLEGQPYSYKLMDNYIIIKHEAPVPQTENPYIRQISGIVKDEDGNPLPGVSVRIGGTSLGVATDIDGKFRLSVAGPGSFLVFSFIGKITKEVVVLDQEYFEITLEDDKKMLEEVVCTGIQTLSRERATGSYDILNSEQLGTTLTPDVVTRLQGKIAGVQIDRNNKLTIRGRGSILSNTEPLVVVDGFPIEGGFESVNPEDIANITVLKDAAAASIWGVRAGNGVIVITTKTGEKEHKPTLDVSYFLTVKERPSFKDFHLLNAEQAVDLQLEHIQKFSWDPFYTLELTDNPLTKVQEIYFDTWMNEFGMAGEYADIVADPNFQQAMEKLKKANFHKQFERNLLRKAIGNRVNLSLRGGSERSDYYISGVYDRQLLESVGDESNNLLFNLKHNYQLNHRLTLSTSVNVQYTNSKDNGIKMEDVYSELPFQNLLDENGKRIQYYMIPKMWAEDCDSKGYLSYTKNFLDDQELNDNTTNFFAARLHAALKWNIYRGISAETRFQYERGYTQNENLVSAAHSSMRLQINNYTLYNEEDGSLTHQFPMGANYNEQRTDYEAWTWRSQLAYNSDWENSRHNLTALLGHEMRMYKTRNKNQSLFGYDPNSLTYTPLNELLWAMEGKYEQWHGAPLFANYFTPPYNQQTETDNRDVSVYMNAAYTFDSKYTLSASGRIDQSNLFGNDSDYKYNFIWSTGLSWRLSEEEFVKADWMDQLLLRLTYGIGGNVNKDFYPVLMGNRYLDMQTGYPYIKLTNPANKDLTWEKSTTFNAGLDFAFLSYRINGSFDYYHKKSTDLLGRVALDPTNGFASANMNFASVLNQGFEITLNTVPLKIKDFTWNLGFNISYNKNEVTKGDVAATSESDFLLPAPPLSQGVAVKGKPLGRLYAYNYAGLDENGEPLLWQDGEKVNYTAYAQNPKDLVYMGTTEAPWFGGLSTSFEYKGITLAANATYKFGHKFRLPVGVPSAGANMNIYDNVANRWRETGDEANTIIPGLSEDMTAQSEIENYYLLADDNVRNAAYLRLNEISLSYALPKQYLKKMPFHSLNVQFQIRNLALWTANSEHVDPEAIVPSTDIYSSGTYMMPENKSFILGIKATF